MLHNCVYYTITDQTAQQFDQVERGRAIVDVVLTRTLLNMP